MAVCRSGLARVSFFAMLAVLGALAASRADRAAAATPASPACPSDDSGLNLPPGFCATIFADDVGHARHLVVSSDGVVYVNTWSGRYYANKPPHEGGFLVALTDSKHTGKADGGAALRRDSGHGRGRRAPASGLYKTWLYAEINDKIVRYELPAGAVKPEGPSQNHRVRLAAHR